MRSKLYKGDNFNISNYEFPFQSNIPWPVASTYVTKLSGFSRITAYQDVTQTWISD